MLWQPSAADEPSWDTMWGPGRPGWHIECSALALRELGTTIDLHGGGTDLIFPHHECERAQSRGGDRRAVRAHWMHTALICKDGEKMSKSLGNLVFVDKLRTEWDPMAIRLALIEHHYRTEWEWDDELMPRNAERLAALACGRRRRRRAICSTRCASASTTISTRRVRSPRSTPPRHAGDGVERRPHLLGVAARSGVRSTWLRQPHRAFTTKFNRRSTLLSQTVSYAAAT